MTQQNALQSYLAADTQVRQAVTYEAQAQRAVDTALAYDVQAQFAEAQELRALYANAVAGRAANAVDEYHMSQMCQVEIDQETVARLDAERRWWMQTRQTPQAERHYPAKRNRS